MTDLSVKYLLPCHHHSPIDEACLVEGYNLLNTLSNESNLKHGYGLLQGHHISFLL